MNGPFDRMNALLIRMNGPFDRMNALLIRMNGLLDRRNALPVRTRASPYPGSGCPGSLIASSCPLRSTLWATSPRRASSSLVWLRHSTCTTRLF